MEERGVKGELRRKKEKKKKREEKRRKGKEKGKKSLSWSHKMATKKQES